MMLNNCGQEKYVMLRTAVAVSCFCFFVTIHNFPSDFSFKHTCIPFQCCMKWGGGGGLRELKPPPNNFGALSHKVILMSNC